MKLLDNLPISENNSWPWIIEDNSKLYNKYSKWPKISIITPSYNQGKFIEETIRSIILQNYPNLEFIIIDGGSYDETIEIIKNYEKYITYWVSEKDNGQSEAIVKGILKSTGEILNWINSDDILAPNALYHIAEAFIQNSDIDFVSGINGVINSKSEIIDWINTPIDLNQPSLLFYTMPYGQQSCFFKRSLYDSTNGINTSLQFSMDFDLYVKLHLFSNPKQIKKHIGSIRMYEETKTSRMQDVMHYENGCVICTLFDSLENSSYSNFFRKKGFKVLEKYNVSKIIPYSLQKEIFLGFLFKSFWYYKQTGNRTLSLSFLTKLIVNGKIKIINRDTIKMLKDIIIRRNK